MVFCDAAARKVTFQAERYTMLDNILYHLDLPRQKKRLTSEPVTQQLVVPRNLRELLLRSYHDDRSHTGPEKTYNTLRQKFYWPKLYADVFEWCKTCPQCQTGKGGVLFQAPLKSLSTPSTIFDRWHIDFLQLTKANEYNYVLVCVESLSLWSVLLPAKTTSAEETARLLHDNIFMVYGCRTLISERGASFRSKLVRSLCKMLGVSQVFTSSRHPQSNSRCEAYNKNILNSLRTRCGSVDNWPSLLPEIGHAFRTSVLKQIGCSPFEVVFGQKPRLPIDETLLPPTSLPTNAKTYYEKMEPKLRILHETVRQNQIEAHRQTAKTHDAKYTVREPKFCVGDRVYLLENPKSKIKHAHKMLKKFQGPYLILESYPDYRTFKIQRCETKKVHPSLIHADRLRLCDHNREKLYSRHFVPGTEVETELRYN